MPTYLSPGVYVEEVPAGTQPIEGVGTSTGAFVGIADRGPVDEPKLITNFTQYVETFGRYGASGDPGFLAHSVFSFFAEGGTRCYVVRVLGPAAAAATATPQETSTDSFTMTGLIKGEWGNRLSYMIEDPGTESATTHFKLTIRHTENIGGRLVNTDEVYDDTTATTVNAAVNGVSAHVSITLDNDVRPDNTSDFVAFTGGDSDESNIDFIGTVASGSDLGTALHALDPIDEVNILVVPDITDRADHSGILSWCEQRGDVFAVLDTPAGIDPSAAKDYKTASGSYSGNPFNSAYGALYYPRVYVRDPNGGASPVLIPSSGAVAGTYANTDATRGVFKAPAGTVDGALASVVGLERQVTMGEHDILNPEGVNVIRTFPSSGIVIWGARTLSDLAENRYVPVRRLLLFLQESLDEGTQFTVFEPNDPTLWGKVRRTLNAFLTRVWRDGALFGNTPEEAFFVKVDEENNPPAVRDAGQLIVEVGVAPVKPAEFVIIRIQQQSTITGS